MTVLRWVGGKTNLIPKLRDLLPEDVEKRRWVEPFFGSGAFYFSQAPHQHGAFLSDANAKLINFYEMLRARPVELLELVKLFVKGYNTTPTVETYHELRDKLDHPHNTLLEQAAAFWMVNKTCFNAMWRENKKGGFNVPWGKKKHVTPPDDVEWLLTSAQLLRARISYRSFDQVAYGAEDFVYLDPPYDGTFAAYTAGGFDAMKQKGVAILVDRLTDAGIPCMVSNADTPLIRSLFSRHSFYEVEARRSIACNGDRTAARELIICNY